MLVNPGINFNNLVFSVEFSMFFQENWKREDEMTLLFCSDFIIILKIWKDSYLRQYCKRFLLFRVGLIYRGKHVFSTFWRRIWTIKKDTFINKISGFLSFLKKILIRNYFLSILFVHSGKFDGHVFSRSISKLELKHNFTFYTRKKVSFILTDRWKHAYFLRESIRDCARIFPLNI